MRALALLALVGCGRLGFGESIASSIDARTTDATFDTIGPDPTFDPTNCPSTYTIQLASSPTHRYRAGNTTELWLDAVAQCNADTPTTGAHTHLAVLGSDAELADVSAMINTAITGDPWLGASDRLVEGTFVANTAEDLGGYLALESTGWGGANEPNGGTTENCIQVKTDHLNDRSCEVRATYLCECDPYPDDPSRY